MEITEKEPQNQRPKLKSYVYYTFNENICSACNPMQVVVFCKTCINFAEQRLKSSNFKGSMIP